MSSHFLKSIVAVGLVLSLQGCFGEPVFEAESLSSFRHTDEIVLSAAMTEDGAMSLVAEQGKVCLWDNKTNKVKFSCFTGDNAKHIELMGFSKDKTQYYISNRTSVLLFSATTGQLVGSWATGRNIARDIAISADAGILLLGYRSGEAQIINTKTSSATLFPIHRLDINSVALSDDGKTALTGSSDKFAYLWNTEDGVIKQRFKLTTRINHVAMNSTASLGFAIDSVDDRVFLDLKTGEQQAELDIMANFMEFNDSLFINDDKWFLTGSPKRTLHLWRVADGQHLGEYKAEKLRLRSSILAIAYNKKSNHLLSETSDGVLEIWPYKPLK
ncbi:hypothetical protein NQT69_12765 [Pseudoalteromonas shioyasakiensis]|uniref:WD40 repeat domain-containing protein n=1 Tax=Pseudoalteromonas shioyasakiensis TaxID=1190813 RepID=UPI002118BED1|nr:hypothetical protein [Pseudoalteromonas shioyasakiensis]MCQ8878877.1 hypothetical protein [Pseudoalteromonas shioyasakiensis]